MAANEKRMKKLAELSGVPYERILKFQKRESANGKYLTGDKGMSAGDLHLYKKTAIAIPKRKQKIMLKKFTKENLKIMNITLFGTQVLKQQKKLLMQILNQVIKTFKF
jgi:hypothetical protein